MLRKQEKSTVNKQAICNEKFWKNKQRVVIKMDNGINESKFLEDQIKILEVI